MKSIQTYLSDNQLSTGDSAGQHKNPLVIPQNLDYFLDVEFDSKSHTYAIRGKPLTSATTILSKLEQPVDWNQIATTKALKEGTDPVLMLRAWQEKSELGMRRGSVVHQFIEARLKDGSGVPHDDFPEMASFLSFKEEYPYLTPIKLEWRIGDYHLRIGGTIDCLFYSEETKKFHIYDWKTGEKFDIHNPWQNLILPFDDLPNCHLMKYSLQLSVYRLILKRNTGLPLGDSFIIKLSAEGYQEYKAFDYSDRIEQWVLSLC